MLGAVAGEERQGDGLRRFALQLAAAEERVLEAHAEAAAGFVVMLHDQLPFERALDMYERLLDVPQPYQKPVRVRALTRAAARIELDRLLATPLGTRNWVDRLARRLQGRSREELRGLVSQAAADARQRVRNAYVAGAQLVADALGPAVPPAEAIERYLDALGLGSGWAEQIFHEAVAEVDAPA